MLWINRQWVGYELTLNEWFSYWAVTPKATTTSASMVPKVSASEMRQPSP